MCILKHRANYAWEGSNEATKFDKPIMLIKNMLPLIMTRLTAINEFK